MPSLNLQILLAAGLGILLGWLTGTLPADSPWQAGVLYTSGLLSTIFIGLLKMVLIPLVFASIVIGVANLQQHRQMHRVWLTTLLFFTLSTTLAMLLALIVSNLFKPGAGLSLELFANAMQSFKAQQMSMPEFFQHFFAGLFQNPFTAFAENNIVAVVVFALFVGVALVVGGERYQNILQVLQEFLAMLMMMIGWIMRVAPLGILALLVKLIATQDAALLSAPPLCFMA